MSKLMDKMLKATSVTGQGILASTRFFSAPILTTTEIPILNVAFSGDINGGFQSGVHIFAGESKMFKSLSALYCMKGYLDKHPDAVGIIYDTEYGITPDYIKSVGVDPERVIHIPIDHVEQLKFDFVKKLEGIEKNEHVFFMVDSLGQTPSKKELEDANDEKSVADMTRAKSIRSLFRLVTIQLAKKELPCVIISNTYVEIGAMFPKTIIPGGNAVTLSANTIFIITKSQEKEGTDITGWTFHFNIHKSRTVQEKTRFSFRVMYDGGIQKYSGLLDMAIDGKFIAKPKVGWYCICDPETGELGEKNFRAKDFETEEIAGVLLKNPKFNEYISKTFKLSGGLSGVVGELPDEPDLED